MAGVFILAPELIMIFSGEEFAPAIFTMRILSLLVLIIGLANIFAVQILIPLAKDKILLYGSLVGGGISICLNLILIPFLQQDGAAITLVIAETMVMFFAFWYARRSLEFDFSWKNLAINIIAVAPYFLIAYAGRQLFDNSILIVLFTGLLSACVFLILQIYIIKNHLIVNQLQTLKARFVKS
jgi:O-antigen/teichoic acid export membrane protein